MKLSTRLSRFAVVRKALRRLRSRDLERQYAQRWAEWDEEEDAIWDVTLLDGLEDEDWTEYSEVKP